MPTAYVTVSLLNLRSGPGTEFDVVTMAAVDEALPIIGQDENWPEWWQVDYNGQTGWVFAPMIETAGPLSQVPNMTALPLPSSSPTPTPAERPFKWRDRPLAL